VQHDDGYVHFYSLRGKNKGRRRSKQNFLQAQKQQGSQKLMNTPAAKQLFSILLLPFILAYAKTYTPFCLFSIFRLFVCSHCRHSFHFQQEHEPLPQMRGDYTRQY
jgi:hypothetical protein